MIEKETGKNRASTERRLLEAVRAIVEQEGFEGVGINAVAQRAGVSKMLIYRYFKSLDGLIAAYIGQCDFWINFDPVLPDKAHLNDFLKNMFRRQIALLREDYTLRRLYRWELAADNAFVQELRDKREAKGLWLIDAVSRLSGVPKEDIAVLGTLVSASVGYLALLADNCSYYNGIRIQEDGGWGRIAAGIDSLIDKLFDDEK